MAFRYLQSASFAGAAAALAMQAQAAHAQSTSPAAESAAATSSDDIIVTANKRSENVQTVPASISVISGKSLEASHATQLVDYAAYVPGLQIDTSGAPGQTTITLRGIAPLGSGSAVGTYIDDVPLGSSGLYALANAFQLDLLPYDLDHVEILRGPQGTLYGASTMGGLLKYTLKAPDPNAFQAKIGADVSGVSSGGGPGYGIRGMVNLPISDTLAVRASAFYNRTPGFIDDPVRNADNINAVRESGGRIALAWSPTREVKLVLQVINQTIRAADDAAVALDPTTGRPTFGSLGSNLPLAQPFTQVTDVYSGSLSWHTPIGTLTSVASHSITHNRQTQDDSLEFNTLIQMLANQPGRVPYTSSVGISKYTFETRLASVSGGRIEWLVGGFTTHERGTNHQAALQLDPAGQSGPLDPLITASLPTTYREWAVFGDITLHLLPRFDLSGGLRYAQNSQNYQQVLGGTLLTADTESGKSRDHILTYSVSPKYSLNKEVMVYARVATGYQPGGPNVGLPGVPPTVAASTLTSYEAGIKTTLFERRLQFDLTGYRMDWVKIQTVAVNAQGVGYLVNGGTARSQGVELSSTLKIVHDLTAGVNFAYTDAKFTAASVTLGIDADTPLPLVPKYSASATLDYAHRLNADWSLSAGVGLRYVGSREAYLFLAPASPQIFPESAYAAADLHVGVAHGPWDVALYAKNLFDRRAYITKVAETDAVTGDLVRVSGTVLQPLTVGLSIDRTF